MNIKNAMESTNKNIKGYRLQRNADVLEILPFKELNEMYYTHAPQLGAVANTLDSNVAIILGSFVVGSGIVYVSLLNKHYLNENIKTLKAVKSMLEHKENNPFEKYDEDDDVVEIIKRNQKEKKLIK